MYAIIHPYTTSPSHEGRNERRLVSSEDGEGGERTVVSVWYRYASFGRVRDSFDDDGVHNLDDQRGKSLCVYSMHMGSLLTGRASLTNEFL